MELHQARSDRRTSFAKFFVSLLILCFLTAVVAPGQNSLRNWKETARDKVNAGQLDAALKTVNRRIATDPGDLEARGWRARLLARMARWPEAESDYWFVLAHAPNDIDIVIGLADVLLWQQRLDQALAILDHGCDVSPAQPEILLRRARVLSLLGRTAEARSELRAVLAVDPRNSDAKAALAGFAELPRHELRFGVDVDSFNYTDAAQTGALTLSSHWSFRWSTVFGAAFYQRFGENAAKLSASAGLHFTPRDWLNLGAAFANDHAIIPRNELLLEYGHGFRFRNRLVRGLESSIQPHWFWYRNAHVLTLGTAQLVYLPKDLTWSLSASGARSSFHQAGSDWQPSGSTRLTFPLFRRVTGNTFFAVGSEDFALVDQIGRFFAHTFGGGLRYRFTDRQDLAGYIALQDRSNHRSQSSFGFNYGFRF
jgi:tetratricopeptide (TPR) repeat protein